MDCTIDIKYENGIVFAHLAGDVDYTKSQETFQAIIDLCKANNCYRILGVQSFPPLKITAAHDMEKIFRDVGFSKKYKIAWVEETNDDTREALEYSAAVLRNRNLLNGGIFANHEDAYQWLLKD